MNRFFGNASEWQKKRQEEKTRSGGRFCLAFCAYRRQKRRAKGQFCRICLFIVDFFFRGNYNQIRSVQCDSGLSVRGACVYGFFCGLHRGECRGKKVCGIPICGHGVRKRKIYRTDAEKADYKERNKNAIINEIFPKYKEMAEKLASFIGKGRKYTGLSNLEGGKEYYEYLAEGVGNMLMDDLKKGPNACGG